MSLRTKKEDKRLRNQAEINAVYLEDNASFPSRTTSMRSKYSDIGNSFEKDHNIDASRPGIPHGFLLASQTNTPRLTSPGSPPSLSASVSPTRTSKPVSPRRHSISFSTSRGMFDDRSSITSSDSESQTGRTRVDGKEFFLQVRSLIANLSTSSSCKNISFNND
ncbi:hypothetical protein REPUB_Repub11eG0070100 [Reevesia pubescens]